MPAPTVVILGAGFAGLTAARALDGKARVVLVDRHNYQTFLPLLYQVSTSGLAADHVAYPIRGALRGTGVEFRMGSPVALDTAANTVVLGDGQRLHYDHLVIAMGSTTADFGIPGVTEHAHGMKTVGEALAIRSTVMRAYERLCALGGDEYHIAVVGGGPTGVEMAGAFAELIHGPLRSDHGAAAAKLRVSLVEAGPRVLPTFAPSLSQRTRVDLEKLGVEVMTDTAIQQVHANSMTTSEGATIPADLTVWAAGVKGVPAMEQLGLPVARGRVDTLPTLQVRGLDNVWAIGDIAGVASGTGMLPMVAPVAMQQGRFLAKQITAVASGGQPSEFAYRDKGSMATIGRHKAVVEVTSLRLAGPVAWLAWLWLHLFYILGGRNKIGTMADWTWNYLTFDRGNRHIMDSV